MITINFFGDFVARRFEGIELDKGIKDMIAKADINVVNYEAPCLDNTKRLEPLPKSGPSIYQNPKGLKWLKNSGFDIVSLANNHIMDYGENGVSDTISFCHKIQYAGCGTWEEAYKPIIIKNLAEGKSVGFLCATHCEFGTLTDRFDKRHIRGCAHINHRLFDEAVRKTRKQVDYLFIFAHAGVERILVPLPEWRERYKELIDMGCDGVIVSHPHVIQGVETYKGKPIAYSLGNFYFPWNKQENDSWYESLCLTLTIDEMPGNISYSPTFLTFSEGSIKLLLTGKVAENFRNLCNILTNDEEYMQIVNRECKRLLDDYYCQFGEAGLCSVHGTKGFIKYIARKIIGKKKSPDFHLINNLRCESHRWAIERALKHKNDIQ